MSRVPMVQRALYLDCANTDCDNGACISCLDGHVNGDETDMDCGGPSEACARCAGGQSCGLDLIAIAACVQINGAKPG